MFYNILSFPRMNLLDWIRRNSEELCIVERNAEKYRQKIRDTRDMSTYKHQSQHWNLSRWTGLPWHFSGFCCVLLVCPAGNQRSSPRALSHRAYRLPNSRWCPHDERDNAHPGSWKHFGERRPWSGGIFARTARNVAQIVDTRSKAPGHKSMIYHIC